MRFDIRRIYSAAWQSVRPDLQAFPRRGMPFFGGLSGRQPRSVISMLVDAVSMPVPRS